MAASASLVLTTLAAGQFLMTLDSSVMNVSMATVAEDLGTTVSGIQTAITLYTLVMASLMIVGGKLGALLGYRRAFAIGLIIYGAGSLTTALAPTLAWLLFGWSLLEGIGAALILPAIVALVAGNFPAERRAAAYGLIAAAGAMAVAAGPLIGGFMTTYFSWRWVFAGEVIIVVIILAVSKRIADAPPAVRPRIDVLGAVLSASGLALAVFGVLRSGEWGWVQPNPGAPVWLGVSPVTWLVLGGLLLLWAFLMWQHHLVQVGKEPLVQPALFANPQLTGGLTMFGFQFFLQAGVFFTIPLFLSVVLELSALETGVRLVPLSLALLATAVGIPKAWPRANPRRVVRIGLLCMTAGASVFVAGLSPGAPATIVTVPLLLIGGGIGALASQLGAVTVSAEPDERSAEVGGLQNTATNVGASLGTALIGSILMATLTTAVIDGIQTNPAIPPPVKSAASVQLADGVPFLSDTDLRAALEEAGVPDATAAAILSENAKARLAGLQTALAAVALFGVVGLFFTGRVPAEPPGLADAPASSVAGAGEVAT
jgi:EmrB/QacA subfamily drug resistance transporter